MAEIVALHVQNICMGWRVLPGKFISEVREVFQNLKFPVFILGVLENTLNSARTLITDIYSAIDHAKSTVRYNFVKFELLLSLLIVIGVL